MELTSDADHHPEKGAAAIVVICGQEEVKPFARFFQDGNGFNFLANKPLIHCIQLNNGIRVDRFPVLFGRYITDDPEIAFPDRAIVHAVTGIFS